MMAQRRKLTELLSSKDCEALMRPFARRARPPDSHRVAVEGERLAMAIGGWFRSVMGRVAAVAPESRETGIEAPCSTARFSSIGWRHQYGPRLHPSAGAIRVRSRHFRAGSFLDQ